MTTYYMPNTVLRDRETKGPLAASPLAPLSPDHMGALCCKDWRISFGLSMDHCRQPCLLTQLSERLVWIQTNPTLSYVKRAFTSLELLCWFAPETASTLFLTPGHICQPQLLTFQKLLCFCVTGFHVNPHPLFLFHQKLNKTPLQAQNPLTLTGKNGKRKRSKSTAHHLPYLDWQSPGEFCWGWNSRQSLLQPKHPPWGHRCLWAPEGLWVKGKGQALRVSLAQL